MEDCRNAIVSWARWGVANHAGFTYSDGPNRMEGINKPGQLPCICDCSAWVTYTYHWAGVNTDPNGQGYNGTGYTGTLLEHGTEITVNQVQPGDVIVYGPGTGEHAAVIVEAGSDPLTSSMGEQGDPNYVRVSQDGRQPQRYLTIDTQGTPHTAPQPAPPAPAKKWTGPNHLSVDQRLIAGNNLASPNGQYGFCVQGDGNVVLYNGNSPIWATNTRGHANVWLIVQQDGNVVLYDATNKPLWSTQTHGQNAQLSIQDDGNVVVYAAQHQATWSTQTQGK